MASSFSTGTSKGAYCSPASCAFLVSGVEGKKVKIVGENPESDASLTYSCDNLCHYALGIRADGELAAGRSEELANVPSVTFELSEDSTTLTLGCRAQKCVVTTQRGSAGDLTSGQSVTLPVTDQIRFTFSRS